MSAILDRCIEGLKFIYGSLQFTLAMREWLRLANPGAGDFSQGFLTARDCVRSAYLRYLGRP